MHYLAASLITVVIAIGAYMFASEVLIDGSNMVEVILLCISIVLSGYCFWVAIKKKTASSWLVFFSVLAVIGSFLVSLVAEGGHSSWSSSLILLAVSASIWSSTIEQKKRKPLEKNK